MATLVSGPSFPHAQRSWIALAALDAPRALIAQDRAVEAVEILLDLIKKKPDFPEAHLTLAEARHLCGATSEAVNILRGVMASVQGGLRSKAAVQLVYLLVETEQAPEALELIREFGKDPSAGLSVLTAYAVALKTNRRIAEAIEVFARAVLGSPSSAVAEHNLAAALGDAERFESSAAAAHRAQAKGLVSPQTTLVLARAAQGLGQFDDAERQFIDAIGRRPFDADVHADLAQLIWRRRQDLDAASYYLDAALGVRPGDGALSRVKAQLLESAGRREGAYQLLTQALAVSQADASTQVQAALTLAWTDPHGALDHAERAQAAAPDDPSVILALCQVNLAAGRPDVAAGLAERVRQRWPLDQRAIALTATAWRLLGDGRYQELHDYSNMIDVHGLDTPPDWPSLEAYLKDLAIHLRTRAQLPGHPVGQSIRTGSQTFQSLTLDAAPVIRAFFRAIHPHILNYIDKFVQRRHWLAKRAGLSYAFDGAWSVVLRPGGYHVNHHHPMGWISSACHISIPAAVDKGPAGWLTFGAPGIPTEPALGPEYFLKPKAGQLILFPSYMWHGTVPFSGNDNRLSIAFDVIPA